MTNSAAASAFGQWLQSISPKYQLDLTTVSRAGADAGCRSYHRIAAADGRSFIAMNAEGETPESILERILGDMDLQILEDGPVEFRCDCTRERTLKLLSLVSADELQDMVDEGEDVEMVCAFCNSKYQYSPDEIAALIEE